MTALSASPPRLLLVEHDPGVRDLLQAFLRSEGYDVFLVASPQEALTLLDAHTFHLVLTDLFRRADQDPFQAIEPLRSQAYPIPVGVISGWKLKEEEVRQHGFACLVRKPFDLEALLTSLAACLHIPLTPEQARQAPVVQAYFAALSARAWDALLTLCTDEVLYSLPDSPFAGTIRGKAAFRTYTEETFRQFPAAQFEEVLVSSRPHGLAARYRSCWATPEGGEECVAGAVVFGFQGERIAQIGIQLGGKQHRVLLTHPEGTPG